jgi:uncharacterized membrane protein YdjX (TVP38/TMEM64 family)
LIPAIVLVALVLAVIYQEEVSEATQNFLEWIRKHPVSGPLVLVLFFIVAVVLCVPGSLMAVGAGWAFQHAYQKTWLAMLIGSSSVWLGAWVGSNIAMLLGRFVLRDTVSKMLNENELMSAIDKALLTDGRRLTFLIRLCPLVPYNVFNYMMGATGVSFVDFAIAGLGMIPEVIVCVFIGTTISSITDVASGNYEKGPAGIILLIFGTVFAVAGVLSIALVVKRHLKEALRKNSSESQISDVT